MKKLMFIVMAFICYAIPGLSQRNVLLESNGLVLLTNLQDDKVKIKKEELPEAAQKALDGDAFKGWAVAAAYKTKNGEYEVELKKGDTTQTVKFDKDGRVK